MSGFMGVLMACSSPAAQLVVTVGTVDGFTFGKVGATGSVAPSTALGKTINLIVADTTGRDFEIRLDDPSLPQNHFLRVLVQTTAGGMRSYFTSDASHSTGLVTAWRWGNGSSPVWTATGTRAIQLFK
jgi:hypothetical protein